MTFAIVLLALSIWVGSVVVSRAIRDGVKATRQNTDEVQDLRLTSRARISTAVMRSGEVSEERKLTRLGRASKARRVVIGGDDDSQLSSDLRRGVTSDG